MRYALQPQGDGTYLFLRDGEPVWSDFEEAILAHAIALPTYAEVEAMIAAETEEVYEHNRNPWRRCTIAVLNIFLRIVAALRFNLRRGAE
jgi:hypothetical protein